MIRSVLVLAAVVLGFAMPAFSADFYKVKLKTKLEFTTLHDGTITMGRARGSLAGREDGAFAEFALDDELIPVEVQAPWRGERNRPAFVVTLPYESLRRIMHLNNGSVWHNSRTEANVTELIDRYINAELAKAGREYDECMAANRDCTRRTGHTSRVYYEDHTYSSDTDNTVVRIQFHDDTTAQSLHLVIDFANRVKKL